MDKHIFEDNHNWAAFHLAEKGDLRDIEINDVNKMRSFKDESRGFFTYFITKANTWSTKMSILLYTRKKNDIRVLECGTDLRYIQELLGHKSSKTTDIYTPVSNKDIGKIKSPLDNLQMKARKEG